jgi:GNAT superfamily N-acetyltransferase
VELRIERFGPDRREDFLRLHADGNGAGWCRCVAWWVPAWDGWGERSADENAALRERLCDAGQYDGLLAYAGPEPVGWCQAGPQDRLEKLVTELKLEPDPGTWAVTCFLVAPSHRRRGVAAALLDAAVSVARAAGASRVEGYPRAEGDEPGALWTGPRALFEAAGFRMVRESSPRCVMALSLVI